MKRQTLQPRQSDISLCHVHLTDDCLPALMSVYFITNIKYSITHLFPVLLTRRFQILKSGLEVYILYSILLHFIEEFLISRLVVVAFSWDKWILGAFLKLFFWQYCLGKHFTDHALQVYALISPHCLYMLP